MVAAQHVRAARITSKGDLPWPTIPTIPIPNC